jgi:hypothetical protein
MRMLVDSPALRNCEPANSAQALRSSLSRRQLADDRTAVPSLFSPTIVHSNSAAVSVY